MWQQRANKRAARLALLKLKRWETVPVEAHDLQNADVMSELRIGYVLSRNRQLLEQAVGIHFSEQEEFRRRLLDVMDTGHQTVDDVLQSLAEDRRKVLSAAAVDGWSGFSEGSGV